MIIHKDIVQGSPEWFAIRKGKMTASHAQEIANMGKGLDTYIYEILAEENSSGGEERFTNQHTERGVELEPMAREMFELEYKCQIEQVGFIEHNPVSGCSPDGLVGEDGGVEIKCHQNVAHFKLIVDGKKAIDSKYIWQIQMNLFVTGRKWWKYVAYNPNFAKSLVVFDIVPDPDMHAKIRAGIALGQSIMETLRKKII